MIWKRFMKNSTTISRIERMDMDERLRAFKFGGGLSSEAGKKAVG